VAWLVLVLVTLVVPVVLVIATAEATVLRTTAANEPGHSFSSRTGPYDHLLLPGGLN